MTETLRVLAVSDDEDLLRVARAAFASGDTIPLEAASIEAAIEILGRGPIKLALVDGRVAGALSLVHHVHTLSPGAHVIVAVDVDHEVREDQGQDDPVLRGALDLGADGVVTLPLHGDAVLRSLAKARHEFATRQRLVELEAEVETRQAMARELRRMIDAAALGEDELVGAALDALAEVAPTVKARVSRTSPNDEPVTTISGDTHRFSLGDDGREVGTLALSGGDAASRSVALELASALSSLLALRARAAGLSTGRSTVARAVERHLFDDILARELEKARRHGRALSVMALDSENVDLVALAAHLRASDVVGRDLHDVLVLLPETTRIGAVRLRRRIGQRPSGIATLLQDGHRPAALLLAARARRELMRTSPLVPLAAKAKSLTELATNLLALPLHDAGPHSCYPLLLGVAQACSMARQACREAARDGEAYVHVTRGPIASAVRELAAERAGSLTILEHDTPAPTFAIAVTSELGAWACAGRYDGEGERVSAVHSADPLLGDWIVTSLEGT